MHRNLKPDNILMSDDGVVKLSDFSLSRIRQVPHMVYTPEDPKERERSGREARRLWYRPPELLYRKKKYSFEVDMWAVGCLLGELTLGEALFSGESEIEQLFKIFQLTGVPSPEFLKEQKFVENNFKMPQWKRVYFGDIFLPKYHPKATEFIEAYIPGREESLNTLCELKARLGPEGLDLLWHLLNIDPLQRMTAEQAMAHPFFTSGNEQSPLQNQL